VAGKGRNKWREKGGERNGGRKDEEEKGEGKWKLRTHRMFLK